MKNLNEDKCTHCNPITNFEKVEFYQVNVLQTILLTKKLTNEQKIAGTKKGGKNTALQLFLTISYEKPMQR